MNGSRHEKGDELVDGSSIFSSIDLPLPSKERAKRIKPKDKWVGADGVKMYPTFEWTPEGDLLLNTKPVDYKTTCGTRVMGQNLGPENGMD